jgi:hypothetical protein
MNIGLTAATRPGPSVSMAWVDRPLSAQPRLHRPTVHLRSRSPVSNAHMPDLEPAWIEWAGLRLSKHYGGTGCPAGHPGFWGSTPGWLCSRWCTRLRRVQA